MKKIKTVITRIKSITVPLLFGMQKRRSFYVLLEIPCKFIITKKLKVAYKLRYILLKKINFQIFKEYFQFKKKYTHLTYLCYKIHQPIPMNTSNTFHLCCCRVHRSDNVPHIYEHNLCQRYHFHKLNLIYIKLCYIMLYFIIILNVILGYFLLSVN